MLDRPAGLPDAVLRWADHADGLADAYLPPLSLRGEAAPAPLLVALHGGFWRAAWDRRHLRPLAQALAGLGWAVLLPEYARSGGRHLAEGRDAPWPLTVEDLRLARRVLPGLLAEVAPGRVSDRPPVLLGHSAGGHLALWWALDARTEGPAGGPAAAVGQVLALAPVADLAAAHAAGLGDGAVTALLGPTGPDGAARRAYGADVAARLRAGERPGCPVVVVHGADDAQVPVAHSTALGADVPWLDVRVLAGVEHFAPIDPLSPAWPAVRAGLPHGPADQDEPDAPDQQ